MKFTLLVFSLLLITLEKGMAANTSKEGGSDKTITIDIPTDLPAPASAEKVLPTHPFYNGSPASEIMEKVQELEDRIEKLEKKVSLLEKPKN